MSPYRRLNHNPMYTTDHTFGNRREKFICTCQLVLDNGQNYLHMHFVLKSGAAISNILKLLRDAYGLEWWATDSQGRKRISGGDPRKGTFHQTCLTMIDTASTVKVVLGKLAR